MDGNHVVIIFQNTFILRRPRVANFTDIIKITNTYIKTTFKDLKEAKKNQKFCTRMHSLFVVLDITKIADFRLKMLVSAERQGCVP